MKKLIIVAHPDMNVSVVNRSWREALDALESPDITVHVLSEEYPDGNIDVKKEQDLVDAHDCVIFQFPVNWYNVPAILRVWQDKVLVPGWAYRGGDAFKGKTVSCAVSTAGSAEAYSHNGPVGHTIDEVLLPMRLVASYLGADYKKPFAWHSAVGISESSLAASIDAYLKFVKEL